MRQHRSKKSPNVVQKELIVSPNRSLHQTLKIVAFCKLLAPNFRSNFQMCIFRHVYEVRNSPLKACCKIRSFCEPHMYIAAYKIDNNSYGNFDFSSKFTDLGPFRAIKYEVLQQLGMKDKTYGWTVEMQLKILKQNFSYSEVPVKYRNRIGVSKVSGTLKGTIFAGMKILTWIFKYSFKK